MSEKHKCNLVRRVGEFVSDTENATLRNQLAARDKRIAELEEERETLSGYSIENVTELHRQIEKLEAALKLEKEISEAYLDRRDALSADLRAKSEALEAAKAEQSYPDFKAKMEEAREIAYRVLTFNTYGDRDELEAKAKAFLGESPAPSEPTTLARCRRFWTGRNKEKTMSEDILFAPPKILPRGWETAQINQDGYSFVNYEKGQTVIMSIAPQAELDGKRWLHFSMACRERVPSWAELVEAKEIFLGVESKAVLVIPPRSEYVNINKRVLHLFVCLEGDPLPDFTRGGGTL